jgi:hypothetical protein
MMTDPIQTSGGGQGRWRGIRGCSCTCAHAVKRDAACARRRGSALRRLRASASSAPVGRGFRLALTIYPSTTVHESAVSEAVSP